MAEPEDLLGCYYDGTEWRHVFASPYWPTVCTECGTEYSAFQLAISAKMLDEKMNATEPRWKFTAQEDA